MASYRGEDDGPVNRGAAVETKEAELPEALKQLRACLRCRLVKSYDQFKSNGCDNCGDRSVVDGTTPTFHGLVSVMSPSTSWVAKWQGQDKQARGMYAITVVGSQRSSDHD